MRQGVIIFAEAPAPALKATVQAALLTPGVTPFLAYADAGASTKLRALVGGPPPRFFPQATRTRLGERMAQAYAFLFVQDYEQVLLATRGLEGLTPERIGRAFEALASGPVHIEEEDGAYLVALRRADFPEIAPIFEEVRWEGPGAREGAMRLLAENKVS